MDYSTILSHSSKLKKNSLYKVTIAETTKELLYQINSSIQSAHDAGLSQIEFKLPINFKRIDKNITNEEIQVAIYYKIVQELERMDYDVKLRFLKNHTLLVASWVMKAEDSELNLMIQKLRELSKKKI